MILRPVAGVLRGSSPDELGAQIKNTFISSQQAGDGFEPSWAVIARTQNARADRCLLIAQPDHARLAGEMAARFRAEFLPAGAAECWKEIAVHDDGWLQFEAERNATAMPEVGDDGLPVSFVAVEIEQSLAAWRGSIDAAEKVSPLGAYMVSGHFMRLAKGRLAAHADDERREKLIREFVAAEENRQARVEPALGRSACELREYVDLLQLCDTLSLYVCCGATEAVEFPQRFGEQRIRMWFEDGVYISEPSLFGSDVLSFCVAARWFPSREVGEVEVRIK
ncbi:MAG TPA: DUF3891 family protein [Terriglobales bacterium]|nr:DUF3891 family protein [Terriglobales bacterium]